MQYPESHVTANLRFFTARHRISRQQIVGEPSDAVLSSHSRSLLADSLNREGEAMYRHIVYLEARVQGHCFFAESCDMSKMHQGVRWRIPGSKTRSGHLSLALRAGLTDESRAQGRTAFECNAEMTTHPAFQSASVLPNRVCTTSSIQF